MMPRSCAASSASAICWRSPRASSERQWSGPQPIGQGLPFDELEDEPAQITRILDAVNRGDVRMIQRGERSRLSLESREPIQDPTETTPAGP